MTAFRLTIRNSAVGERKYIRRIEGRSLFAHLCVQLESRPGEVCRVLVHPDLTLPHDCVKAAEAALLASIAGGAGNFPMHGFVINITGGNWIEGYSTPEAFAIAAEMALEDALRSAGRMVLEPWVGVQLRVEKEFLADVFSRMTKIIGVVHANVSWDQCFILRTEVPVQTVKRLREIHPAEVFMLPLHARYREVPTGSCGDRGSDLDGWT